MVDSVLFSSQDTVWETPPEFFEALDDEFNFTLDAWATHENHLCDNYFTEADNGLIQDFGDNSVFGNPPYGDPQHPCPQPLTKCKKKCCTDRVAMAVTGVRDVKKARALVEEDAGFKALFEERKHDAEFHTLVYVPGIVDFMQKHYTAARDGARNMVCLVPNRSDTSWYVDTVPGKASEVRTVIGRLKFKNRATGKNDSAPFPSIVVVYHHEAIKAAEAAGIPVDTKLRTMEQPHAQP